MILNYRVRITEKVINTEAMAMVTVMAMVTAMVMATAITTMITKAKKRDLFLKFSEKTVNL